MADRITIARPYAKAAFAHASAAKLLGPWSSALGVAATVVSDPGVLPLLTNPNVTRAELAELVISIVGEVEGAGLDDSLRNFIRDLASNQRLGLLPEVTALFNAMKDEAERTLDVEVSSAAPLEDGQRSELTASLEKRLARSIRLHCTVDPSLIGGAIIRAGDLVIDGSLRSRLDRFQYELSL